MAEGAEAVMGEEREVIMVVVEGMEEEAGEAEEMVVEEEGFEGCSGLVWLQLGDHLLLGMNVYLGGIGGS